MGKEDDAVETSTRVQRPAGGWQTVMLGRLALSRETCATALSKSGKAIRRMAPNLRARARARSRMRAVHGEPRFTTVDLGDFEVACMLGRGSFGQVFVGRVRPGTATAGLCDSDSDRENDDAAQGDLRDLVAIKVLDKAMLHERGQLEHTLTERRVMLECRSHPFVLGLKSAFQTASQVCLVSDFCPGGEVYFHLNRKGRFDEATARLYAAEALDALVFLHGRGVAYRDLKCENMLLDATGHVQLADFGLSRMGVGALTGARTVCGSVAYMAPEMILCHRTQRWRSPIRQYGRAVDLWSFGIMLYDMLVGETPFQHVNEALTFRRILSSERVYFPTDLGLSAPVRSLILSLLRRCPNRRLGCKDPSELYRHPFFAQIDWPRLRAKGYPAPIPVEAGPSSKLCTKLAHFDTDLTHLDVRMLLGASQWRTSLSFEAQAEMREALATWDVVRPVPATTALTSTPETAMAA